MTIKLNEGPCTLVLNGQEIPAVIVAPTITRPDAPKFLAARVGCPWCGSQGMQRSTERGTVMLRCKSCDWRGSAIGAPARMIRLPAEE